MTALESTTGLPLDAVQQAAHDQFGRQSHRYARGHILEDVADVKTALRLVSLPARARVLDVATGAGYTGLHLASLGHDVTLSDLTEPMLERARENATLRGLKARFCSHTAECMPHPDASFDLVTCRVAPHHFSAPDRFIAEVARVLTSGGWLLLIDGTVPDDEPEAEAWLHQVEKLRDPSHHRFLTPREWRTLCAANGLAVRTCELHPKKQPDLNWYFDTAGTSPENRQHVLALIARAPESARRLFELNQEDGKIVWWWPILTLAAQKQERG
jgi:ubiquinone/menaquinone biosynthesis C-methylase UbiE